MCEQIIEIARQKRYSRWNLSLSILIKDPLVKGVPDLLEKKDLLKAVLFKYGLDIDKHYDMEVIEHRNEFGEVVHCPLWMGIERHDQRWKFIKSLVRA